MRSILIILSGVFVLNHGYCQFDHEDVFPGLDGDQLYQKVIENYKTSYTMPYGTARDTLYKIIDILPGNKLECIYTGDQITLDLNEDPTMDAFDKGINAEHSYPQSKGAEKGLGKSDLHHLYPCRADVNSDRSSFPYGESNDNQTDFWYYKDVKTPSVPSSNIDLYSELNFNTIENIFEPRESVKGNIARGIFYFYTIYRQEALDADSDFFEKQRETLCQWHFDDPVDEVEWKRSKKIAEYQDNIPNPFVLDCSLASRLYCNEISDACWPLTATKDVSQKDRLWVSNPYPNPAKDYSNILISSSDKIEFDINLLDVRGEIVKEYGTNLVPANSSKLIKLELPLKIGIYFIKIQFSNGKIILKKILKND